MKKLSIFIAIILLMSGCAYVFAESDCPEVAVQKDFSLKQFKGDLWCRHRAILAAIVYGEYYPVRLQIGPIKCGGFHVQAQAFIYGKWEWLRLDYQNRPYVGKQDDFFTPQEISTIEEYLDKEKSTFGWTSDSDKLPRLRVETPKRVEVPIAVLPELSSTGNTGYPVMERGKFK